MTDTAAPPGAGRRPLPRRLLGELWFQVVLAAAVGIAVGLLFPGTAKELKPLNDWFVGLVEMIVVPVVFCVVTTGIAAMDNLRAAGRIGVKAIGYFIVFSLVSMLIGLVVANVFQPGSGLHVDPSTLDASAVPAEAKEHTSFTGFVSSLIPGNLLGAVTGDNILAALMVSIVFGVALNLTGEQAAPLTSGIRALSEVVFRIVGWVMRLAPIGTLGALATVVATYGAESLKHLGFLIVLFTATCVVYVLVVLGAVMRVCRFGLFALMRFLRAELLVALSTCSSEAVLPQLVRKLETLGVGRPVVGIVVPSGFSFNLDGSAVYLTMASLFLAQAVGVDLSWQQQLVMVGIMMLTSKGTAGIAGGAFIVLASTITSVGHVPLAALSLIVGIDRILNEGRVFINVLGNAIAAIVIGKWEGDFDADRARKVLYPDTGVAADTGVADPPGAAALPGQDDSGAAAEGVGAEEAASGGATADRGADSRTGR
ncbi:cation:dicarboxylate symporter family transporter [Streptomyces sp. NPDC050560]|uniref:cation:dicarboxylate symporter family transporter n=1 Tax=Streptomyces sp. NPDC050560 TaxID=3365630 RepID=UPI0037A8FF7F